MNSSDALSTEAPRRVVSAISTTNDPFTASGYPPDYIRRLQALAEALGHIPTRADVETYPAPWCAVDVYDRLFDNGYEGAQRQLNIDAIWDGDEAQHGSRIPTAELIRELRRLADSLGRSPRAAEMRRDGQYSTRTYYNRFEDDWETILNKAGLEAPGEPAYEQFSKIPEEELIRDVHEVASDLGHPPSIKEYRERGDYHPNTIARRIGDEFWQGAMRDVCRRVDDAALTPDKIRQQGGSTEIPDDALEKNVEYVQAFLGHPPSADEYQRCGSHSSTTVARRFGSGSWTAAMRTVLGEYSRSSDSPAQGD